MPTLKEQPNALGVKLPTPPAPQTSVVNKNATTTPLQLAPNVVQNRTRCPINIDALIDELKDMVLLCDQLNTTLEPKMLKLFDQIKSETRQITTTIPSSSSSRGNRPYTTQTHTTARIVLCSQAVLDDIRSFNGVIENRIKYIRTSMDRCFDSNPVRIKKIFLTFIKIVETQIRVNNNLIELINTQCRYSLRL